MSTAAADTAPDPASSTWRVSAPHVRKALTFLKRQGGAVNAEDLVAWDWEHGRRLFDWDNTAAADEWRKQQARCFLNRFRGIFDGMRVRAFIHISKDDDVGIKESGYVSAATIAETPQMRVQVIDDIVRRMKVLASELRFWKLSPREQAEILDRLAEAMATKKREAA